MAFQSMAAATTDLWPSLANTLMAPWRGTAFPKPQYAPPRARSRSEQDRNLSAAKPVAAVNPKKTELPDFLRDATLPHPLPTEVANMTPTNIRLQISNMSRQMLASANPLFRRTPQVLLRPFGVVPGFRSLHTYQPSRIQPLAIPAHFRSQQQPYRGFGSGGISRSLLANREAAANRNPSSATAQNAFYQLLLKANMPAIVVERYQCGRFATNEAADEAYEKALQMLNGTTVGSATQTGSTSGGLNNTEVQVGQAVAAHSRGGTVATASKSGTVSKDGRIHVVVDEPIGASIFRWVKFLFWFGLMTYLSLVFVTVVIDGLNLFKRPGGKLNDNETKAENQKTRFSDVHGCEEAKEEVQDLVEFLRNPEKFNNLGGKLPKGVLLVGPPGTGKTLLARAVAGEAGVPFFYMSGSEFDEIYVGVGAKRVRELFAAAKAKSPSIIFIDELDAIGGRRNSKDAAYVKQTLNQLLTELDGFEQNSGVIILGATNFPEALDKALTRPGRFDRHVSVDLPDVRGRIAILKHHASKIKKSDDVNLAAIAGMTAGLSGAELENIVNSAAVHASKAKKKFATQQDFDWAKDKVLMGAERKSMVIGPKEKEMTAYHEAGHALMMFYANDIGYDLYKVTVLPRGRSLGHTAPLPEPDKYSIRVKDFLGRIDTSLGGKVAEEIVYGSENVTSGASSDLQMATNVAWAMVSQLGMSEKLGNVEYRERYDKLSESTKALIESEVRRLLNESYSRTKDLLTSKRKELDLLAKALVDYETLDRSEVEKVIRGEKLPDRVVVPPGPMAVPLTESVTSGIRLPPAPGGGEDGPASPPPPPAPAPPGGVAA